MATETRYVKASVVEAFPYTQQKTKTDSDGNIVVAERRDGRVLSEENIALLISKITDNGSYVIDEDLNSDNKYIEFLLGGRYFKIVNEPDCWLFNPSEWEDESPLYVSVVLNDTTASNAPQGFDTIKGPDTEDQFLGLAFTRGEGTLCLLEYKDNVLSVPAESKFHINSRSIRNIDGGVI